MLRCIKNSNYDRMIKENSFDHYKNGIVVFADDGCHVFIHKIHVGWFNTWKDAHIYIDSLNNLCSNRKSA